MKSLGSILAAFAMVAASGCATTHPGDSLKHTKMLIDSSYATDKDVTVLGKSGSVRIGESMKRFEDNPNITQADLDAGKRIESKEVKYLNKGDKMKIREEALPTNK